MTIIAIDPGANGGIACMDKEGRVWAYPMPDGMTDTYNYLDNIAYGNEGSIKAIMEKTGHYVHGNSGPTAATFARHCGHLEAILFCLKIPCEQVAPAVWMKSLGSLPKDKQERKRAIKEQMATRYPHLRVTLKTADALGILTWYLKKY